MVKKENQEIAFAQKAQQPAQSAEEGRSHTQCSPRDSEPCRQASVSLCCLLACELRQVIDVVCASVSSAVKWA